MGLTITDPEIGRLAAELALLAGETETEAVRVALLERKARLTKPPRRARNAAEVFRYLEETVWPGIKPGLLGKRVSKEEIEELTGYCGSNDFRRTDIVSA